MSCGAIGKQKYTDSTLLEPREAGKFEAFAITFKMDEMAEKWPKRTTAMAMSKETSADQHSSLF